MPATDQQWHWAFHTCNGLNTELSSLKQWSEPLLWKVGFYNTFIWAQGLCPKYKPSQANFPRPEGSFQVFFCGQHTHHLTDSWWGQDVLKRHQAQPLHAMVGGGDQIYNDGVWAIPPLVDWRADKNVDDNPVRLAHT